MVIVLRHSPRNLKVYMSIDHRNSLSSITRELNIAWNHYVERLDSQTCFWLILDNLSGILKWAGARCSPRARRPVKLMLLLPISVKVWQVSILTIPWTPSLTARCFSVFFFENSKWRMIPASNSLELHQMFYQCMSRSVILYMFVYWYIVLSHHLAMKLHTLRINRNHGQCCISIRETHGRSPSLLRGDEWIMGQLLEIENKPRDVGVCSSPARYWISFSDGHCQ